MQKITRTGRHSLAVVIPADFVHSLGVKAGESVTVRTDTEKGEMTVEFTGAKQLSLISMRRKKLPRIDKNSSK